MLLPTLNIAMIQMDVAAGYPETNYQMVSKLLAQAMNDHEKPDVIVLPEMWNTGYAWDSMAEIADELGKRTKQFISDFAKKNQVYIVAGSIAEKLNNDIRNTMYVFDRDGQLIADYSKIHLFGLMEEDHHLVAGEKLMHFQIENISASGMICYDIRFPELSRKLAIAGAKIMFIPAEWPNPRLHHWRTLLLARAIENQMYIIACNRVGTSGSTSFFGHSLIIDPWGEIIVEGGEEAMILKAKIDLNEVEKIRKTIPVFKDRRPELYE